MEVVLRTISPDGLQRFGELEADAASSVARRFFADATLDAARLELRRLTQQYLAFHLEFLKPVLQFGLLNPMVEYLRWLSDVCAARNIPRDKLAQSLDWLGEYFTARMSVADGAVVCEALQEARDKFMAVGTSAEHPSFDPPPELLALQAALIDGDHRAALAVINAALDAGRNLVEVEADIIKPAMYYIGDRWQANEVSVAQEHLATAIVELAMTAALLRSPPPPPNGRKVVLACVAGNHHSIGLRMVSDAFQLAGWETQYLGANVPTDALVAQIVQSRPDLVGLGLSFGHQLGVVKDVIAELSARMGATRPAVMIGGLAVNQFDRIADMAGADASSSDARAAVMAAAGLVAREDDRCRSSAAS
jgi:methanogenic corrinoid protein MtbC1